VGVWRRGVCLQKIQSNWKERKSRSLVHGKSRSHGVWCMAAPERENVLPCAPFHILWDASCWTESLSCGGRAPASTSFSRFINVYTHEQTYTHTHVRKSVTHTHSLTHSLSLSLSLSLTHTHTHTRQGRREGEWVGGWEGGREGGREEVCVYAVV
jgi:hypothetical protein